MEEKLQKYRINIFCKLALAAKFINQNQYDQLLDLIQKEQENNNLVDINKIFIQFDFLLPHQQKLLNKTTDFLIQQYLDKRFGIIAIKKNWATSKDIQKALSIQINDFKKHKKSSLIGDILILEKVLTKRQRDIILEEQKRLKKQPDLQDTINKIFNEQLASHNFSKKFGVIAVKKKLVSVDAINSALKQQKTEIANKSTTRSIGEILVERGVLTEEQRDDVLDEQKRIEIDKVIQKALPNLPQNDAEIEISLDEALDVFIDGDQLTAYLRLKKDIPDSIRVDHIKNWLANQRRPIRYGVYDSLIDKFLQNKIQNEKIKIAEGKPPVPGVDAKIEYCFDTNYLRPGTLKSGHGNKKTIDYKDRGKIPYVEKGALLAKKLSMQEGKSGINVFGKSIPAPRGKALPIWTDKKTVYTADNFTFYALVAGQPQLSKTTRTLSIAQEHKIQGDIGLETGHIDVDVDVTVTGKIQSGFKVRCLSLAAGEILAAQISASGNVKVEHGISGAMIRAMGDVDVKRGLMGANTTAHGNISAKFVESAIIIAYGDINVEKEILESSLVSSGFCKVKGKILSSRISAKNGVQVIDIGSKGSVPSEIRVGIDDNIRVKIEELNSDIRKLSSRINDIKIQKDEKDKLYKEIYVKTSELAQIQENILKEQKTLKQELSLYDKDDDGYGKIGGNIYELEIKYKSTEEAINRYFDKQDIMNAEVSKYQKEIETIELDISDLRQEVDLLIEEQKGTPVVEIRGTVIAGTTIAGANSRIVLKQTRRNVRIEEVKIKEKHSEIEHWEMKIFSRV